VCSIWDLLNLLCITAAMDLMPVLAVYYKLILLYINYKTMSCTYLHKREVIMIDQYLVNVVKIT